MPSTREKREKRKQSAARRRAMKATDGSLAYRMPEGMSRFKKKAGRYKFDILGFKAGKGNPDADAGEWVDSRIYYIHKNVGGSDDAMICPLKTAGKPCPICEARAKEASKKNGDDDIIKSLKPQKRQAFQLKQSNSDEIELYDDAEFNFGKRLNADLGNCDESEGHDEFFRHSKKAGGRSIKASFAEIATQDFSYTGCDAVKFLEREEEIDEDILKKVVCLDDVINAAIPSYGDLKKKFSLGAKDDDDEDDSTDDDDTDDKEDDDKDEDDDNEDQDDDEDEDEDEIEFKKGQRVKGEYKDKPFKGTVIKVDKASKLVHVETDDEKKRIMDPEDLEVIKSKKEEAKEEREGEDDEDEDEKKSSKSSKPSSKKASKDEDDEDDEDDDLDLDDEDDEEEEKPKKKEKKKSKDDDDDEDDDDDIPFDDDEEEEEEKPKKKKK